MAGLKPRFLSVLLALCLTILPGVAGTALAGANPPPTGGYHSVGPAVSGKIAFAPSIDGNADSPVVFTFLGECRTDPVVVIDQELDGITLFSDVLEESIPEFYFQALELLPAGCAPEDSDGLAVNKVRSYQDFEPQLVKQAEVILLFKVQYSGKNE